MKLVHAEKLRYLTPLKKWRLMDLKTLMTEGDYPGSPSGFRKFIINLERKGVISSHVDLTSQRKFVYFTKDGELQSGAPENLPAVNLETFDHDSRLSMLGRCFYERDSIDEVELEHELTGTKKIGERNRHIPDGILKGKRNGVRFSMALELEISRKSKKRYLEKIRHYLNSSVYDYVLYFFAYEGIMKSYKESMMEEFGKEAFEKVMLALNENITKPTFQFSETSIYLKNKEVLIDELF
jgi:hypothetical protein